MSMLGLASPWGDEEEDLEDDLPVIMVTEDTGEQSFIRLKDSGWVARAYGNSTPVLSAMESPPDEAGGPFSLEAPDGAGEAAAAAGGNLSQASLHALCLSVPDEGLGRENYERAPKKNRKPLYELMRMPPSPAREAPQPPPAATPHRTPAKAPTASPARSTYSSPPSSARHTFPRSLHTHSVSSSPYRREGSVVSHAPSALSSLARMGRPTPKTALHNIRRSHKHYSPAASPASTAKSLPRTCAHARPVSASADSPRRLW